MAFARIMPLAGTRIPTRRQRSGVLGPVMDAVARFAGAVPINRLWRSACPAPSSSSQALSVSSVADLLGVVKVGDSRGLAHDGYDDCCIRPSARIDASVHRTRGPGALWRALQTRSVSWWLLSPRSYRCVVRSERGQARSN